MKKYLPKPLDDCSSFDNGETVSLSPVLVSAVPAVFRQLPGCPVLLLMRNGQRSRSLVCPGCPSRF